MGNNKSKNNFIKPIVLVLIIVALIVLSKYFGLGEKLGDLKDWIKSLGLLGPIVFSLIYAVAVTALVPGSALTIMAGAIFGSALGTITVSFASTSGAALSFLISRYFARDAVSKWLSKQEKFNKLDELTDKHGSIIVAITRLVPIFPFTLLNYGFGMTKVSFKTYLFWSWLCMLPGTIMYVVGSDAISKATSEGKIPWPLVAVFVSVILIITFIVKHARKVLQEKEGA